MAKGPREFNSHTLPLTAKVPDMPSWLPQGAAEEWERVTGELGALNVLCDLDIASLAQYCILFDQMQSDPSEFTAAKHTQLRLITAELGLTPAARRRLMVLKHYDDDEDNPFSDKNLER